MKQLNESTFDFSNLLKDDELYSPLNKLRVGVLKDEVSGRKIIKFRSVSPKCYFYEIESRQSLEKEREKTTESSDDESSDNDTSAKCKGIPKLVVEKLTRENYEQGVIRNRREEKM